MLLGFGPCYEVQSVALGARESRRHSPAGMRAAKPVIRYLAPMRQCSRPLCSREAAATLWYDYPSGAVVIDRLAEAKNPHSYDMCAWHAGTLKAPAGWSIADQRAGLLHAVAS